MKAILAVDLEEALTANVAEALHRRGLGARVLSVSGPNAAEAVREGVFDVVVVDLAERRVPPPDLLRAIAEGSPATSLVMLAGAAMDRSPAGQSLFDGIEILERSQSFDELSARIATALQRGVKGHLENVGLAAFTQLLAAERESCTLEVRSAGRMGAMRFLRGELWDAQVGPKRGEEAALEIFAWETADIVMSGAGQQARRTITDSLTYLLIEAMRRRDELVRDALDLEEGDASSLQVLPKDAAHDAVAAEQRRFGELVREIDGFVAACVVDLATGLTIASASLRTDLDLELAGAFSCESVRQARALVGALRLPSAMEDVVFTWSDQIHLIRLSQDGVFCIYLVADRAQTGYPQMRAALQSLWPALEAEAEPRGRQSQDCTAILERGGRREP